MTTQLKNKVSAPNSTEQAIQSLLARAEKHIASKEINEGIALLESAEIDYPDNPKIPYLIGKYTADKKSIQAGIKKLETTLEKFPTYIACFLELGHLYIKSGHIQRANPLFHKALELAPLSPSVQLSLGALNQRKGDLPLAIKNYRKAIELQLKHPISNDAPEKKEEFKTTEAEKLLWSTLLLMAKSGVHMFPIFGTLLGLVRNSALLAHDKDLDTGLPFSEIDRAVNILSQKGWVEANNSFGLSNPRCMLHTPSGITMDISGFAIDDQSGKALTAGAWIPGVPKEWNMIWEFNEITLEKKPTPNDSGQAWFLKNPEQFLEVLYGDWRTPDKNFDTMVRAKNLRSFSLLAKCFAYSRIFENWTDNNIPRALALTRATLERDPNDALLKRVLSRLETRRKEIMNG